MQVSEILDSELLGEGLIPTLQHAHDQLLVENPRTVPHCATTYAQVLIEVLFCLRIVKYEIFIIFIYLAWLANHLLSFFFFSFKVNVYFTI